MRNFQPVSRWRRENPGVRALLRRQCTRKIVAHHRCRHLELHALGKLVEQPPLQRMARAKVQPAESAEVPADDTMQVTPQSEGMSETSEGSGKGSN